MFPGSGNGIKLTDSEDKVSVLYYSHQRYFVRKHELIWEERGEKDHIVSESSFRREEQSEIPGSALSRFTDVGFGTRSRQ